MSDLAGSVSLRALDLAAQVRAPGHDASGRAEQVTHQLESAIGLGLLSPGERLPTESIMAEHLGVSPLTLRQSLAVLRSKGLLETRRGRGGGSYVTGVLPVVEADIARMLLSHTSDDLRDLVDLAGATAGSAARLACHRADEQDLRRLRSLAKRFAASSEAPMLRQTDARLHIGLGVAAQSRRLTALLIQIHAELSPLAWSHAWEHEQESADTEHGALLDAIERGDARAAEDLAVAHVEREGALIIDQHLALLTAHLVDPR
ncbi:FCD domain-containing protein [Sinomonas sp. ASV486]|uniref:FadR/GntR family transcriptional regulator n=1 Tax=Sinomonas sp. ASV486 TaxID=3051170 RepID=UPI0027DB7EBD|nr:FCD domain-containing protein [Sinomonas sp. ASV486]MDQ4491877.1 FCD domain-containing protein [Sinomonas sp. ASV486]